MLQIKSGIKYLKNKIRKFFNAKFIAYQHNTNNIINVTGLPLLSAKSFGDKNPDKLFYVIMRSGGGAGFFSNLTYVLVHIQIAETLNMIPVVDFENFPTFYNEKNLINNSKNAWDYYFKPINQYSLSDVYSSKHVFFCDGDFPWEYWDNNLRSKAFYQSYFNKYIATLPLVNELVEKYGYIFNKRVLAIHFRGKEMNYAPSHYFAPTLKQMMKYTDIMMEKYNLEKIFFVTEEKDYLDAFIEKYGDKVIFTDSFCVSKVNAYNLYPRENHKYLLGLEILRDTILLSKCNALLCSSSNVSEVATFLGNHEAIFFIDNGMNSSNFYLSKFLYDFKKVLPKYFGGLKNNVIITESIKS